MDKDDEAEDLLCVCGWEVPVTLVVQDATDAEIMSCVVSFMCPVCGEEFEFISPPPADEVLPKNAPN